MSSSIVAKKDIGERKISQRLESRITKENRLEIYSLGTEEVSNQGVYIPYLQIQGLLETFIQGDFRIALCLSLFPFLKENIFCNYSLFLSLHFECAGSLDEEKSHSDLV